MSDNDTSKDNKNSLVAVPSTEVILRESRATARAIKFALSFKDRHLAKTSQTAVVQTNSALVEDDSWVQEIRDCADELNISEEILPRFKADLLALETLNLSEQLFYCSLPNAIGNLSNLTVLNLSYGPSDLSDYFLYNLPASIGNLTNLTELGLTGNYPAELPDTIGNLTNLEKLKLSSNKIAELPPHLAHLRDITRF